MSRAGVCSVTFRAFSKERIIEIAKSSGLSCIEWGGDVHVPHGDVERAKSAAEKTAAAGLTAPSYGSYYKCDESDFTPVSKSALALGASVIRVWAGSKGSAECDGDDLSRLIKSVRAAADAAKINGQTLAFEYHYGTFCDSADSVNRLIDSAERDNIRSYWQPMYWNEYKSERERIDKNLCSIRALFDRIENVHVYNWRSFDRYALKDGAAEWREYILALPKSGNLYLEFTKDDSEEQFKSDAAALLELTAK